MPQEVTTDRSFRRFYDDNVERVMAVAVALTADRAAAEDVTQEAFARAYRDWERVGTYDRPDAWVRRVAVNLTRSRWRKLRNEAVSLARLGPLPVENAPDLPPDQAAVWRAVRRLPRRQAAAIALHYVEGLPVAEIAEVTGVAVGTTKSDLHRGRARLADLLDEEMLP